MLKNIFHLFRKNNLNYLYFNGKTNRNFSFSSHRLQRVSIANVASAPESDINLSDLTIKLESGKKATFNLTWLRDSCFSNSHEHSRQRLLIPKDFKNTLFTIEDVSIVDVSNVKGNSRVKNLPSFSNINSNIDFNTDEILKIVWADQHVSYYRLDWLIRISELYKYPQFNNVDKNRSKIVFTHPDDDFYDAKQNSRTKETFWDVATLKSHIRPIDFNDLVDNFEYNLSSGQLTVNRNLIKDMSNRRHLALKSLCSQLVEFGLAKIEQVPLEKGLVLKIARSIAYERVTGYGVLFDVVVEPTEERNLAYSSLEFDLHSDLTYREISPGVQLLHCIRDSKSGGLSFFSDAIKAAQDLKAKSPKYFDILTQYPCTFIVRDPYRNVKFRRYKPIIGIDCHGNIDHIYYSPFMLPPVGHHEDVKLFYLACELYTRILHDNQNKLVTKMEPGDLFIFNNRRVLHGRSAYDSFTSHRYLQGCYLDWDEIECLHEKLMEN